MKQFLLICCVAVFSIFIGSQITEGVLLVPYWKSLTPAEFYSYYAGWGPSIGRFYTILTIVAALIPVGLTIYSKRTASKAFKPALVSSLFAILFVACFYFYFKDANQLFYQAALSDTELKQELITWSTWHWGRIVLEGVSLVFLIVGVRWG